MTADLIAALEVMDARWDGYNYAKEEIRTGIAELTTRAEAAEARVAECEKVGRMLVDGAMPATESGSTCFVPRYQIDKLRAAIDALAGQPAGELLP
jgi:hypothetical protein